MVDKMKHRIQEANPYMHTVWVICNCKMLEIYFRKRRKMIFTVKDIWSFIIKASQLKHGKYLFSFLHGFHSSGPSLYSLLLTF